METLKLHLFLFLLFGLFGCKSVLPKKNYGNGKDCSVYYEYVQQSWKKNADGYFELTEKPKYDNDLPGAYQLVNRPCLEGLSINDVVYLYGEPSFRTKDKFEYFMTKECHQGEGQCIKMQFFFDANGTVKRVPLLTMSKNPSGLEIKNE